MSSLRLCRFMSVLVLMTGLASVVYAQTRDTVAYELVLIGDAGDLKDSRWMDSLLQTRTAVNAPASLFFLGDNIYPKGLPPRESKERKVAEKILLNQVSLGNDFNSTWFIPGNHDWKKGHREGLDYIMNQQRFFDSLGNRSLHFPLRDGCPGPEEIILSPDLVLIALNTQWFLHPWEKQEGEKSHCEAKNAAEVAVQFDDMLSRHQGKRVIVMGHHPVFTYGPHGGYYTFKDHVFPLTAANHSLWIPLPIVGSLMPIYRSWFGDIQDEAHPLNRAMRTSMQEVMEHYPGTVYVSGHEHSLQHIYKDSISYVVSGSGSKSSPVVKKGYSTFASAENGFARILIYADGRARTEYYGRQSGLISVQEMPRVKPLAPLVFDGHENDTLWVEAQASKRYETTPLRKKVLGENYRKEWAARLHLQAFDISKEMGGLKILKRGGGMETMTLRLEDSLKRGYSLRSVEKFPIKAMRPNLRKTFLQGVVQDQISAEHPYGALAVAPLAEVAGIYHTNPKLVYAPYDMRWGSYRKDFSGQIVLLEERPDGKAINQPNFGNATNMISTHRLLEHMQKDHDHVVDQQAVLRARLFDMLIGDWDRHDDQWRWAAFDDKKLKVYKPIPRDRDQAFFVNDGFVPSKLKKKRFHPELEGFDDDIEWAPGFMRMGRWFDRTFLNEMTRTDFEQAAKSLADQITDTAIDSAVKKLPPVVFDLHGEEIIRKLKARKKILQTNAASYYDFLSKEVTVTGSDKREWFEGNWKGGKLDLTVYKRDKEGNKGKALYHREFLPSETKAINLFGLDGDDHFQFNGLAHSGMLVRVIGGPGNDEAKSEVTGATRIQVYDEKNGITMSGHGLRNKTSKDPKVNEYDRKEFEYNKVAPKHTVTYNIDDGVFIGTGFSTIAHGFRKKPYRSHHMLQGSYAIRTSSFNIRYEGRFPQFVGKWDLEVDADMKSPNYVNNFFGWGNESVFDQTADQQGYQGVSTPIDYYRLRFKETHAEVKLKHNIGQWGYFKAGPIFQIGEIVDPSQDRYIKEYNKTLQENILASPKQFGGFIFAAGIDKRDNHTFTTRGIVVKVSGRWMRELNGPGFTSHNSSFTLYQTFRLPAKVTYVLNVGGGHNTGTYQLYQAQALDGKTEIRGFRKTRFYGDTKAYMNNELRMRLGSIHTYLFPANFGVHAFYDVGRVWYSDLNGLDPSAVNGVSDVWHKSFGGGLWFTPYDLTTIVTEVGSSNEGTLFYLRLGFLF